MCCKGTIVVAAFLGVSIQYVIKAAGGEELNVFAQNTAGRSPRGSRWAGRCSWPGGRSTRSWSSMPEGTGGGSSVGPAGSRWRTRSPAAGSRARAERARREATPVPAVVHPKVAIGDWTFSNWPLYIDKDVLKEFDKRYGGHVKYVEDINDNDEFYGKVRQQLRPRSRSGATS